MDFKEERKRIIEETTDTKHTFLTREVINKRIKLEKKMFRKLRLLELFVFATAWGCALFALAGTGGMLSKNPYILLVVGTFVFFIVLLSVGISGTKLIQYYEHKWYQLEAGEYEEIKKSWK